MSPCPPAAHAQGTISLLAHLHPCVSATLEPSYVLRAIGVDEALAHTSIRIGLASTKLPIGAAIGMGRFTTEQEIDETIEALVKSQSKKKESISVMGDRNPTNFIA